MSLPGDAPPACPVCFEECALKPFSTLCNHALCDKCAEQWRARSHQCPICRQGGGLLDIVSSLLRREFERAGVSADMVDVGLREVTPEEMEGLRQALSVPERQESPASSEHEEEPPLLPPRLRAPGTRAPEVPQLAILPPLERQMAREVDDFGGAPRAPLGVVRYLPTRAVPREARRRRRSRSPEPQAWSRRRHHQRARAVSVVEEVD